MLTNQLKVPSEWTGTIRQLQSNLQSIQPTNSENEISSVKITQIITYTLLATALVGIAVYHYIKTQEKQLC